MAHGVHYANQFITFVLLNSAWEMKMPCDLRMYGHTYREYFILRNMKAAGHEIGRLGDVPLHEVIEDEWGRSYRYVGVCSSSADRSWGYRLNAGEFILPPGVVYRLLEGDGAVVRERSHVLKWLFARAARPRETEPREQQEDRPVLGWNSRRDGRAGFSIGARASRKK